MPLTPISTPQDNSEQENKLLQVWMDLTGKPDIFLDGPSPESFTMLCNHSPSNEIGWSFPPSVTFESKIVIYDEEEASVSGTHMGENALKRYISCMILMYLPEKGVDEAFDWLADAWQFYTHPVSAASLPALAGPAVKATGKATILRPALDLTEE
jgi:hypothetical protein